MSKNITYLFGAGASFYACPIWKEQGERMVLLKDYIFNEPSPRNALRDEFGRKTSKLSYEARLLKDMLDFGERAIEFNTIDTYAKKLYLLKDYENLNKLKSTVSLFFTLWNLAKTNDWKYFGEKGRLDSIDHRYINLLANYLEEGNFYPCIKSNIRFITWNYDLQIESAYNKFTTIEENKFQEVNEFFPFIPIKGEDLVVCHLNGFHGFYKAKNYESLYDKENEKSKNLFELLETFSFLKFEDNHKFDFNGYINYAWEKESELANYAREQAKKILRDTDILVIIGYSFPPFNDIIDKELFEIVRKRAIKVIYQDIKASEDILIENFNIDMKKISIVNNCEQFVIPNYILPTPRRPQQKAL